MRHILRDSAAGQLIRFVTSNTVLLYPEEEPDFELPKSYANLKIADEPVNVDVEHYRGSSNESSVLVQEAPSLRVGSVQSKQGLEQDVELGDLSLPTEANSTLPSLVPTLSQTPKSTSTSRVIRPVRTSDGNILVDWYTEGTFVMKFRAEADADNTTR
jgi:DHA1 family multidrug resistance protein-like MFS transporter